MEVCSAARSIGDYTGADPAAAPAIPPGSQTFPALSGCPGPRLLPVHSWLRAPESGGSWEEIRERRAAPGRVW